MKGGLSPYWVSRREGMCAFYAEKGELRMAAPTWAVRRVHVAHKQPVSSEFYLPVRGPPALAFRATKRTGQNARKKRQGTVPWPYT